MAAVVTLALTLIVIPGTEWIGSSSGFGPTPLLTRQEGAYWGGSFAVLPPDPNTLPGPLYVKEFMHGWPLVYARRAVGYGGTEWRPLPPGAEPFFPRVTYPGGLYASWSVPGAWPWRSDRWELSLASLLVDAAVAIGILMACMLIVELWLRRRGGFRLRLIDLLVATAAVALLLGFRQWHIGERRKEDRIMASVPTEYRFGDTVSARREHDSMRWLTLLLGTPEVFQWRHHIEHLTVDGSSLTAERWHDLSELRYLRSLLVRALPTAESLKCLPLLREVQELAIEYQTPSLFAQGNSAFSRTRSYSVDEKRINLASLAEMRELKTLVLSCPLCLIEDLEPLLDCQCLETVHGSIAATEDDIAAFVARHRPAFAIEFTQEEGAFRQLSDDELQYTVALLRVERWKSGRTVGRPLRTLGQTRYVDLSGVDLDGVRLEELKKLAPVLDKLRLGSVSASDQQLCEFLSACPRLRHLDLGRRKATDHLLRQFRQMESLTSLDFRQGKASVAAIKELGRLPELEEVEVYYARLLPTEVWEIEQAWEADPNRVTHLSVYRGEDRKSTGVIWSVHPNARPDDGPDPFGGGSGLDPFGAYQDPLE